MNEVSNLDLNSISWTSIKREGLDLDYAVVLPVNVANKLFSELEDTIEYFTGDLAKIKVFGKTYPLPRQQVAYGDPGISYTYSGITVPALPWPDPVLALRDLLFKIKGIKYDFVLVNKYKNGNDHMGEHRDNEPELDPTSPIASISLGQERQFILKHKDARKPGKHKKDIGKMGRNSLGREARKKGKHTKEEMRKAIEHHLAGESLRKSAKVNNIPYPTLRRYVNKFMNNTSTDLESNYSTQKVFTAEQELCLKEYIIDCANKFYGLTTKQCRQLAYEMAKMNDVQVPSSWDNENIAGKDWLRGFRKRHPEISIRKPEPCNLARASAQSAKRNVTMYFNNLRDVMRRHPDFGNGTRIYNLDETATTTVQRPQKVLAHKGQAVSKVTSGEHGVLVTTCCIVNALGQALPPALVFPRKHYKPHMLHGAPPGSLGLANPSGWMNGELFVDVMKHFIKHSSASKSNPALLIMDNHESHLSLEAIELAKSSGVTILTLHPHTTAKLQPLDVGLNGPFKTFYNAAVDSWLLANPGKPFTIYEIAQCVGQAYLKAMTPSNITAAFKKTGIFPYDDSIFTDIDFLPSSVTDRPIPATNIDDQDKTDAEDETSSSEEVAENLIKFQVDNQRNSRTVDNQRNSRTVDNQRNSRTVTPADTTQERRNVVNSSPSIIDDYLLAQSPEIKQEPGKPIVMTPPKNIIPSFAEPSTSKQLITPEMFRPPLKAGPRNKNRRRQPGRSLIATDTPEKEAIAEKKIKKDNKKAKVSVKKVKQNLFEKKKNTKKIKVIVSSDDEDGEFKCSGSSSGGEIFISDEEDEEIVLNNHFSPLERLPREKEYVIVEFKSKAETIYYIAQILELLDEDEDYDYFVKYFKLKSPSTVC